MANWKQRVLQIRKIPFLGLLINIFIAITLLVVINFYSLKIMSAMRAYIHGESSYSKAEKEATQYLINYLHTQDTALWVAFLEAMEIPVGDTVARRGLLDGEAVEKIRGGFLRGGNHPDDIDQMIWLFSRFRHVDLMATPIKIWRSADSLIYQKFSIARQINQAVRGDSTAAYRNLLLTKLQANSMALNARELVFSDSLGTTTRTVGRYLFYVNVFITLAIMAGIYFYVFKILARLKENNKELAMANKELDRLVYAISHDLRAPINSMKGLVGLAQREQKPELIKEYLAMMNKSLLQQETFVKKTIELSRERSAKVNPQIVELDQLIEETINLHRHMPEAAGIAFKTNVGIYKVFSDKHHLEVILRNLVSNAIKYHDGAKQNQFILIQTSSDRDKVKIEVVDNGIGIDDKDQQNIFNMYYKTGNSLNSSGLGLHIVSEMMKKLEGAIAVQSSKGVGTTFTLLLRK